MKKEKQQKIEQLIQSQSGALDKFITSSKQVENSSLSENTLVEENLIEEHPSEIENTNKNENIENENENESDQHQNLIEEFESSNIYDLGNWGQLD